MDQFLEYLNNNPWLNVIFILLAIMGIVATIMAFYGARKEKQPFYFIRSFNLLSEKQTSIDLLEVRYNKVNINNLTSSQISFFNMGKLSIKKEDIAPKDRLRIEVENIHKILDAKINYIKNNVNNFSIKKENDNCIYIDFDFIGSKEGLIIQIYHTGKSSSEVHVKGTLIDSKPIINAEQIMTPDKLAKKILYSDHGSIIGLPIALYNIVLLILNRMRYGDTSIPKELNLDKD